MLNLQFLKKKNKHYFHVLAQSCLPMALSFSIGFFLLSIVLIWGSETKENYDLYITNKINLHIAVFLIFSFSSAWFFCILNESGLGHHNFFVKKGLTLGFFFFLITEFMLFFSFFWGYFYLCLNPSSFIGNIWPPNKTTCLDIWTLPFFNTILLLVSGYAATIAHAKLLDQKYNVCFQTKKEFTIFLTVAVFLGTVFLFSQALEYRYAITNNWANNSFWSFFFLLTGFHGIHVLIGVLFLTFNLTRVLFINGKALKNYIKKTMQVTETKEKQTETQMFWITKHINEFCVFGLYLLKTKVSKSIFYYFDELRFVNDKNTKNNYWIIYQAKKSQWKLINFFSLKHFDFTSDQHLGYEMALFYWHFVDVVWIFLFVFLYVWGL